jgi:glycosyltransferase involved in cell wall biosynthesis
MTETMGVSIVAPLSFPAGGAAASRVRSLAFGLHEAGARVRVFALAGPGADPGEADWRGVHCTLEAARGIRRGEGQGPSFPILAFRRLVHGRVDQKGIDALLLHLRHSLKQGETDVVILYHQQPALALRIFGLCRRHRRPYVQQYTEMHMTSDYRHGWTEPMFLRERLHMALAPRLADGHIVISRLLEQAVAERGGTNTLRIPALNNTEPHAAAPSTSASRALALFTYIGAGTRRDCVQTIIDAAADARMLGASLRLALVGLSEETLSSAVERTNALALGSVVSVRGYVEERELDEYVARTDVFVLLRSPDRSAVACFPTRLPEYLATGRPTIVTDVGDISLYLKDGHDALLVKPAEKRSVAHAIATLSESAELRERIGAEGRRTGARAFDYREHGRRLLRWLHQFKDYRDGAST